MRGSSSGSSSHRCVALPFGMHTPVVARHVTARWLAGRNMSPEQRGDVVLIVSELVTNAVRHGRSRCTLTLTDLGGDLDIAVADRSEGPPEVQPGHGGDAPAGRGLVLVQRLGGPLVVAPGPGGKTVHAVVHLNGPAQVPRASDIVRPSSAARR
ncbi:ATP-binding protein [Streptomyces peucetius subsp. caesius ATCC 27952]|nr:ATP-binding protein [Streptomyces peucetius subsp. caesius ATCC 27952]